MSFFEELKRRKVIRVGIAYVIGAWLLLQLTEVLSELLSLPATIGPIVVALVALGLPVALFLSWAYEITADGIKRDSEISPDKRSSGKLINVVVVGLLLAALGYFIWESRFSATGSEQRRRRKQRTGRGRGNWPLHCRAALRELFRQARRRVLRRWPHRHVAAQTGADFPA